jgi:DNA polymerase-3 subunit gamma/tau
LRQALYRAYRPRDFDEVVGQEHITAVLKNEMAQGRPSHAYLFVGSRGTGKTSCAKLVAKAVNCLDLKNGNPCGVCERCRGVDDGSLLDVVEIDAASNNGVDDIRALREEAVFSPAVANFRVYIIDEVHMLSSSAFNALLKILEEPPEHVIFVLATTEVHKVLPTIISRCQRFDFGRIESSVIARRLLDVAAKEGILLAPAAAERIARLSDGGLRDALSLLDVCAASAGEITEETVEKAAGLTGSQHLFSLADRILEHDSSGALVLLSELFEQSMQPQRLCEQMVGHWRALMLAKTVPEPGRIIDCAKSEEKAYLEQNASVRIGRSAVGRAELELAVVSLCEPSLKTSTQALAARVERIETALLKGVPAAPGPKNAPETLQSACEWARQRNEQAAETA